ncbi:hypothetical protein Pmani_018683 [Petrolisthes manimaculis]|uniref:Uncharacterized protein n=1 Tax=Petrolisthes manimaculis TaxID=1843537 RepID=A0AAE1PM03_9EUCA|nr:hypothetical protein Pmani_018683 [Petrolisthes manimaculis]
MIGEGSGQTDLTSPPALLGVECQFGETGCCYLVMESGMMMVAKAIDHEEDLPFVIDFGDDDIHFHEVESEEENRMDTHRYRQAGKYKVTVMVEAEEHIFFERFLVVVWDRHFTGHPHIHDECVNERARYYLLDLALRWFYILVLFFIIILLVALIIIAWLLGCSVCALKKI